MALQKPAASDWFVRFCAVFDVFYPSLVFHLLGYVLEGKIFGSVTIYCFGGLSCFGREVDTRAPYNVFINNKSELINVQTNQELN